MRSWPGPRGATGPRGARGEETAGPEAETGELALGESAMGESAMGVVTACPPTVVDWRVSTRSGSGSGDCVEVGPIADGSKRVAVRDSRDPDGSVIVYTWPRWAAFISALKDGEYDRR